MVSKLGWQVNNKLLIFVQMKAYCTTPCHKEKNGSGSPLPPFCEKAGLSNSSSGIVKEAASDFTTCLFKSCKNTINVVSYKNPFY